MIEKIAEVHLKLMTPLKFSYEMVKTDEHGLVFFLKEKLSRRKGDVTTALYYDDSIFIPYTSLEYVKFTVENIKL